MREVINGLTKNPREDWFMRVFLIVAIVINVCVIAALLLLWRSARVPEFQPFRFPEQQVLNRLPGHGDEAAALVGTPIIVRGEKCNTSKETFATHGIKSWSSVSPPGNTVSQNAAGKAMRPGCKLRTFVNAIPPAVLMQMKALLTNHPYVVWQITGTLTAEREHGATRSWQTQPFYIYPQPKE